MGFDLTTFVFTNGGDEVVESDTLAIASAVGSPFNAILVPNEGTTVNTFDGDDLIDGLLDGTVDTAAPLEISGIQLLGDSLLSTGLGEDTINGEADFVSTVAFPFSDVAGIRGGPSTVISTGARNDVVSGRGAFDGNEFNVAGIRFGTIQTGDGKDTVSGTALGVGGGAVEGVTSATGLDQVTVNTGSGDDVVEANATVDLDDDGSGTPNGISESTIQTGKGQDDVLASISITGQNEVSIPDGQAINFSDIFTGGGNDKVLGSADATVTSGSVAIRGITDGIINTGTGKDEVSGTVVINGGANTDIQGTDGIRDPNISTGGGNDQVTGSVEATLGDGADAFRVDAINVGTINTGSGKDSVTGTIDVTVGENSRADGMDALNFVSINTGAGNDEVVGIVTVSGGPNSTLQDNDGIDGATINTGSGNDRIEGTSNLSGTGLAAAFGDGINSATIHTGMGDDEVFGTGADIAIGSTSSGIVKGSINLGKGDDLVVARGGTQGVRDVDIFGGDNDDIFDLHSGTGFVDGGNDDDLLILSGNSEDFAFLFGEGTDRILGGNTDLNVVNIEQFQFDDGTFGFDDLFLIPA